MTTLGQKSKMNNFLKKAGKNKALLNSRFNNANLVMFAVIFAGLGAYIIFHSFAAGFFSGTEPENGTITSPASVFNDSNASGGKGVQFGVAGSTNCNGVSGSPGGTDPWGGCWPGSNNTGYKNAPGYPGSLTAASSSSSTCPLPIRSNFTYRFCDFAGGTNVGSTLTAVSNVSFIGCDFHGGGGTSPNGLIVNALILLFGSNISFDYISIHPDVAAPPVSSTLSYQYGMNADGYNAHVTGLSVKHADIWGFGNALDVTGATQAGPHVYEDNYIHDACFNNDTCPQVAGSGVYHTDGIGDLNPGDHDSYVTIHHNVIATAGNTNGLAYQYGPYDHFTVTNNYFSGFGYTINIGGAGNSVTNTVFTDNVFGTDFKPVFGPLYGWQDNTGNLWRRNKWHIAPGTTWSPASNDGKFWTPNGISSTDYSG
jgi:hypothetical protein